MKHIKLFKDFLNEAEEVKTSIHDQSWYQKEEYEDDFGSDDLADLIAGKKVSESVIKEKSYPSFADPLEGFPTEYKELLKKLQRSNNEDERTKLIDKMNIIRKNIKLKPLTNESAGIKKTIHDHWFDTYGKQFITEYPGIAKILKTRPTITRDELARIWDETHEENFEKTHPKIWNKLD